MKSAPKKRTGKQSACWGCECGVPIVDGRHAEPTDMPGIVYTYACTKAMVAKRPRSSR